jgi:hypothetical protein
MDANASASNAGDTAVWADPSTLSDVELEHLFRRLEAAEKTISRRRAVLHDRIDFVRGGVSSEIFAAGDQLEALQRREQEIAEERRVLHEQIDELRAERGRRRAVTSSH